MKTTRLILAFAAALSLGLAVFANVLTHNKVTASTQSVINSDAALSGADSAANGIKVADGECLTAPGQAAANGIKVADGECLTAPRQAAATGIKVADGECLTAPGQSSKIPA
jgi:uncharacterized low-complexity protein